MTGFISVPVLCGWDGGTLEADQELSNEGVRCSAGRTLGYHLALPCQRGLPPMSTEPGASNGIWKTLSTTAALVLCAASLPAAEPEPPPRPLLYFFEHV